MFADGGIDPLDPKRTEVALLGPAIAIGVLTGLLHRLTGDANGIFAAAVKAFRLLQNRLMTGVRGYTPFNT